MSVTEDALLVLKPEEKQFFDENGYYVARGLHSPDEVEALRAEIHELMTRTEGRSKCIKYDFMEPSEEYGVDSFNPMNVVGMMDHTLANDFWFDHFTDPRVVAILSDVLGPNIDFHNGKIRNKPPGFEAKQGWHQDFPYERHDVPHLAAAITYLEETRLEAGSTEVLPGTHRTGEWDTFDGHRISEEEVQKRYQPGDEVVLEAKPGDVLIFHVLTLHRAGHNYTNTSRHAIINEYKTMEAVDQWGNTCAFAGLPLVRNRKLVMPRVREIGGA